MIAHILLKFLFFIFFGLLYIKNKRFNLSIKYKNLSLKFDFFNVFKILRNEKIIWNSFIWQYIFIYI